RPVASDRPRTADRHRRGAFIARVRRDGFRGDSNVRPARRLRSSLMARLLARRAPPFGRKMRDVPEATVLLVVIVRDRAPDGTSPAVLGMSAQVAGSADADRSGRRVSDANTAPAYERGIDGKVDHTVLEPVDLREPRALDAGQRPRGHGRRTDAQFGSANS